MHIINFKVAFCIGLVLFLFILKSICFSAEYLWAGTNQYQLWFHPSGGIEEQLNAMVDSKLKVIRIFLGHRESYMSWENPPGPYTFEDPIGNYNDANLLKVDYLMSVCKERGIRMIVSLHNPVVDYYWPHIDEPYIGQYGKLGFYNNPDLKLLYKNRIAHFLNHENDYIDGGKWKDLDDVILAWEVQNEWTLLLLNEYVDS